MVSSLRELSSGGLIATPAAALPTLIKALGFEESKEALTSSLQRVLLRN